MSHGKESNFTEGTQDLAGPFLVMLLLTTQVSNTKPGTYQTRLTVAFMLPEAPSAIQGSAPCIVQEGWEYLKACNAQ